ncbi:hypothetical protein BDW22DRAFT_1241279 [Trametopsis cervina]|nr:hypothetical protein BDW22DRAFT_1241279 [Trametopsis cervina]
MSNSERLSMLLSWCTDAGIQIDPRLEIIEDKDTSSLFVRNRSSFFLDPHITLVSIPKHAILSVRSCTLASEIPFVPYGYGAQLCLSLALYSELLQGSRSRWSGYLQSLPQTAVQIALFWGSDELQVTRHHGRELDVGYDSRQAANLAKGTEIGKMWTVGDNGSITVSWRPTATLGDPVTLFGRDFHASVNIVFAHHSRRPFLRQSLWHFPGLRASFLASVIIPGRRLPTDSDFILRCKYMYLPLPAWQDEVREYYHTIAEPILGQANFAAKSRPQHGISISGFLHAYTLVSSRAFLVDAYHGLAMVPIADVSRLLE